MVTIAQLRGISLEFSSGLQIFKNLNLILSTKKTALVGPNGVGKTALARLLVGDLQPSQGEILRRSEIFLFSQREPAEIISVQEYLTADYDWTPLGDRLLKEIDPDRLCSELSGGQWMKVRLAKALRSQYLILDEPTNDLDEEGRKILFSFLRDRQEGFLLISHDRECLSVCQDILELTNQGIAFFGGDWSFYQREKHMDRERRILKLEQAKKDRDQADLDRKALKDRQEKRNQRGVKVSERGGMPKILIGARKRNAQKTTGRVDVETYENTQNAVRQAFEAFEELKVESLMYADLVGQQIPNQKIVAQAQEFNILLQDWIYKNDLSFSWRGNIRMALKGGNGSGKTILLKALLGESFRTKGHLQLGNLKVAYLDQNGSNLDDSLNIFENVRKTATGDDRDIRNSLARFLFTKDRVFQKVSSLSGGERLRVNLAQALLGAEKPELLILDEPTNNLDLLNTQFLENLLKQFKGALIIVSHDPIFLQNCGITQEFWVNQKVDSVQSKV